MHSTVANRISGSFWSIPTLSLALALGVCMPGLAQQTSAGKSSAGQSATGLLSLPASAQGVISAALGKDDSSYWVRPSAAGLCGENPRHALVAEFTRQGAEVRSHNLRWSLETRSYGYGDNLPRVRAVAPHANANRVEYRRDGVTEWYENGPLGLEQGFTFARRPEKANSQPLTVELALRGDLLASLQPDEKSLELKSKDGKAALRYTGLTARDATGQELRSWLEIRGERLLLRVEDEGARYPLVVDPWLQQAELTSTDGAAGDWFGWSVAVSGTTAVVGATGHTVGSNQYQGEAYVFVESDGAWSQQAELTSSDGAADDEFGYSVAVSGSTAVVGAPYHTVGSNQYQGVAYVFVQNADGSWGQQAELIESDGAYGDYFGASVSVSGSLAVVGAANHESEGVAVVFVQNGDGTWSEQAGLTAYDEGYEDHFGSSVAISGSTALVGAPDHTVDTNGEQGAAYVFVQSGTGGTTCSTTWCQQAELIASDGATADQFGSSVSLSGSTAVVGAAEHKVGSNTQQGAAYVFVQSGTGGTTCSTTWCQQAELTASDGKAGDGFGGSVAVSGSTTVVGAGGHAVGSNTYQGAAYVFVESDGTWSQQAELTSSDGAANDHFGSSVAVNGSTAVVGAWQHTVSSNSQQGAAYVFTSGSSQTTVTLTPTSLSFGKEAVNTTSKAKTVTLKNTGTAPLDITSPIAITLGTNFEISNNTCGTTLAENKTCKVSVTFTPTELGALADTLTFTDNATGGQQTVPLSGTGVAQATLTPASLTFGKTKVGTTSAAKKVTLKNNLPTTLTGISYSTTGPFAVSTTTCGTTLNSKKSCTISVTFSPLGTGTATGTLDVSDSANSPQSTSLSGTGD